MPKCGVDAGPSALLLLRKTVPSRNQPIARVGSSASDSRKFESAFVGPVGELVRRPPAHRRMNGDES